MSLSSELIDQLVKVTQNTEPRDKDNTAYGTVVIIGSKKYVKIDGSDLMTPVSSTVAVENGDRVIVMIKSHSATITGNTSSPAASDKKVTELGTKISDFEIVIADKVSAKELDVQIGRIDDLTADNATIKESLTANKASIDDLTAKNAEITGTLEANKAKIDDLDAKKLDTEVADIKYASVDSLDATDANLRNLKSDYAQFEKTTTGELEATNAKIDGLDTKYANVDFSNIGKAAIEQFYATSGIIKDLVVGDQTITGELVGITISGDLIKGDTIVADKLVIKGSDGLYYKLNTDGVTTEKEQTEYNSLNGQVIQAKSITATKIDVKDLVAFGATIGGFNIGQDSIFSGVKETVDNKSRGIYMDKNGQIAIGDVNNYIKYFKDTDGRYRLKISAASLEFNASGDSGEESKDLETVIKDINDKVDGIAKTNKGIGSITNYYLATSESSGVTTETAGWTTKIQNVSSSKKYLWNYEVTKYTDDTIANTTEPCIIGMYSAVGATGNGIQKITEYYALSALKDSVPTIWSENVPNLTATNKYMWNYEEILYTNGGTELTKKRIIGVYGDTGEDGAKGEDGYSPTATVSKNGDTTTITIVDKTGTHTQTVKDGTNGTPGKDGINGKTTYFHVKYSNDGGKTFTSNSGETVGSYIGTCTNYTEADPTTVGSYVWAKIKGEKGETGNNGKSIGSVVNYYLATSASSGVSTSTSGWTTTVQNVTLEKKYLWNYEVVKYSDGTVASTTSPCIIGTYGDTGKTGATGATGNGIKSIKEHYAVSTSNTVTPTSWLDDVPVTNPVNKYLWNYETITYTNGTSVDSKKRVIGVYGDTGKDGAKGEKGDDFRWNLVKGTNVASTAGWSTNGWSGSFDTLSKDDRTYKLVAHGGWRIARYVNLKEYIGQKVTISFYAKNVSAETTATSDYSLYVSNETGDNPYFSAQFKPNEAKPKQDVWEYYSYTIKTVNSDGQLGIGSACRPEGNGLKSTWLIKDLKIELGSPATPWSPHPDDLIGETGSSMLVLQTAYSYYQTDLDTYATAGYNGTWTIATSTGVKTGDTVYLKVKNATKNGDSYIIARVNSIQSSTSVNCTSIGLLDKGDTGATGPKGDGLDVKDTRATNESPNWYFKNYPKTTVMEFKECNAIGLSNVGTYCNLQTIVLWGDSSGGYPRQTAKIEGTGKEYWRVGTSDTTWSSWIDPYGKSLEAAKTATNFMEFTSGAGLQIGDKTNGSWKGFRSRITSTAFEILNEAGTAVASYGRKLIQLGKDSVDAVIELCGGKGSIKHENVGVYGETKSTLTVNGVNLGLLADDSVIIRSEQVDSDNTTYTSQIYMTKGRIDIATFTELEDGTVISSNGVDIDDNIGMDIGVPGETETALSKARINGRSLLDFLHPVGSIYMSTNATNPTNLFGGTWVAWGAGRVPVGFNGSDGNFNSSEKTGGSKTINIQHNHGLSNARAAVGRADSSLATMSYTSGGNPHNVYFDREFSYYGGISGGSKHATDTSLIYGNTNDGGSTAASVLQPYITCYMWKRTA